MAPVFLINLDRSPARLLSMSEQCERLNIPYERISATDGIGGLPEVLRTEFLGADGASGSALTPGEIGCYASHLRIFSLVLERELPAAIVLEDDIALEQDFLPASIEAIEAAPAGWDVLHLSTNFKRAHLPVKSLANERSLVRYVRHPTNTAAYAISSSGARKLRAPRMRVRPIDLEFRYWWELDLDMLGVSPALARQLPAMASDVGTRADRRGFEPSLRSRAKGYFLTKRKLGLRGTFFCWGSDLRRRMGDGRKN